MQIHRLTAFQVPIALRKPVRHASHIRDSNETLVIRCELTDGSVGWGEGLPRVYVTGESIGSVWRHLHATDFTAQLRNPGETTAEVVATVESLRLADIAPDEGVTTRECFGNSVRAAIELSVLDAYCRSIGQSRQR